MRVPLLVAAALALWGGAPDPAAARQGLIIGSAEDLFTSADAAERTLWMDRAVDSRLEVARLGASWREIASGEPAEPRNPADAAYDFDRLDDAVRDARARGISPLLTIALAPDWALGKKPPADAPSGTWKPKPGAFGAFLEAVAQRYSGEFPDPENPGQSLPRVRRFQAWNEANLETYLTPQWKSGRPVGAGHYRRMLISGFEAVHRVHANNELVAAGLAPYGEDPGGSRVRPLRFWREVLCLRGRRDLDPRRGCGPKAKLDIFSHHAINTSGPPETSAIHPDDASSGDLPAVRRVLRAAERGRTIKPAGRRDLWVTEFWWESNPPDPSQGVSLQRQARYIQETMQLAWKAGFSAVIGLQVGDAEVTPATYDKRNAAGIYFFDGEPKPARRAFRFPFVAEKVGQRKVRVWGKAPVKGRVLIERKKGSSWRRVKRLRVGKSRVFNKSLRLAGKPKLRARAAGETSLSFASK